MKQNKKQKHFSFAKYLPVLVIMLSLSIIASSTFAFFTNRLTPQGSQTLNFGKVELSADSASQVSGTLMDAIPGDTIINGPITFSLAEGSRPVYVRAKISYSTDSNTTQATTLLRQLRRLDVGDYGLSSSWSSKVDDETGELTNYFYLVDGNGDLLKVENVANAVPTTYTLLSNGFILPTTFKNDAANSQYMQNITFHIAFQAIQADNIAVEAVEDVKSTFNALFPESESEKIKYVTVTYHTENVIGSGYDTTETRKLQKGERLSDLGANAYSASKVQGYIFKNWATRTGNDPNYTYTAVNNSTVLNEDLDLYAIYAQTHTVTFKVENPSYDSEDPNSEEYVDYVTPQVVEDGTTYGSVFANIVNPSKASNTFAGWATSASATASQVIANSDTVNSDITLYPVFVPYVTATFYNGANVYQAENLAQGSTLGNVLSNITAPTSSTPGLVFIGWATTSNATEADVTSSTVINENTPYYAVFVELTYYNYLLYSNPVITQAQNGTQYDIDFTSISYNVTYDEMNNWEPVVDIHAQDYVTFELVNDVYGYGSATIETVKYLADGEESEYVEPSPLNDRGTNWRIVSFKSQPTGDLATFLSNNAVSINVDATTVLNSYYFEGDTSFLESENQNYIDPTDEDSPDVVLVDFGGGIDIYYKHSSEYVLITSQMGESQDYVLKSALSFNGQYSGTYYLDQGFYRGVSSSIPFSKIVLTNDSVLYDNNVIYSNGTFVNDTRYIQLYVEGLREVMGQYDNLYDWLAINADEVVSVNSLPTADSNSANYVYLNSQSSSNGLYQKVNENSAYSYVRTQLAHTYNLNQSITLPSSGTSYSTYGTAMYNMQMRSGTITIDNTGIKLTYMTQNGPVQEPVTVDLYESGAYTSDFTNSNSNSNRQVVITLNLLNDNAGLKNWLSSNASLVD